MTATTKPDSSMPQRGLREAKEALRTRVYAPGERARRDRILAGLAAQCVAWRTATR